MNTRTFLLRVALAAGSTVPLNPFNGDGLTGFVSPVCGQSSEFIYIDSQNGSDGNSGHTAWSNAWKTIAKLDSVWPTGVPTGKTVYLKRGGVYTGQINIAPGALDVSVRAHPTDQGAKPVVEGGKLIDPDEWFSEGGGLWSLDTVGGAAYYLYDSDTLRTSARYPNTGWMRNRRYWTYTDTLVPPAVNYYFVEPTAGTPLPTAQGDVVGSTAVFRSRNWHYELPTVLSVDTGVIRLSARLSTELSGGENIYDWGFFFQGTFPLLDTIGEWCYVPNEDKVYYMTGDTAAPPNIRISTSEFGVNIDGNASNLTQRTTVKDISFKHQGGAGIRFGYNSHRVDVMDCDFSMMFRGIDERNTSTTPGRSSFRGNVFRDCYDKAVRSVGDSAVIVDNSMQRIGMVPGLGEGSFGGYTGMDIIGEGYVVEGNRLHTIGYAGMNARGTGRIENNHFDRCMAILNDGGGIQFDGSDGLVIRSNIITNLGDPAVNVESSATVNSNGVLFSARDQITYGIYFGDKYIRNTLVEGNIVSGCYKGIHVDHSLCSQNATIRANTLFNNKINLSITDYSNYQDTARINELMGYNVGCGSTGGATYYRAAYDDLYEDNIIYCLSSGQSCMTQYHQYPEMFKPDDDGGNDPDKVAVDFGTFQNNYYFNPFSDVPIHQAFAYDVGFVTNYLGERAVPWTLEGWQALPGTPDVGTTGSPLSLRDFAFSQPPSAPLAFLSDSCDGTTAVADWGTPNGPEQLVLAGNNKYLRFNDVFWMEKFCTGCTFPIEESAAPGDPGPYLFTFRMRSANTDALRLAPIWSGTQFQRSFSYVGLNPDWSTRELLMDVSAGGATDLLVTAFQNVQYSLGALDSSTVDMDYVTVRSCTLDTTYTDTIAKYHILRFNNPLDTTGTDPSNVASFDLIGCWSDVYGNIWTGTVDLDPWESIVLYRLDMNYDINVAEYEIATDTTWATDMTVRGSVVVRDGATLTIDSCTIGFADSRQADLLTNIVVEPGGTLELINGAHLTSVEVCGTKSMWDGIMVLGDTTSGPAGKVVMDSCFVSNALAAILCGEADPLDPGRTGLVYPGRFFVQNSTFENNRYDIVRHGIPDVSDGFGINNQHIHIVGNTFTTSAHLNYPDLDPVAHILIADHHYVFLANNTFANDIGTHTQSHKMGHGIDAMNVNLRFWEPNSFRNLDHAIHSVNTATSIPQFTDVSGCRFTDNICAIYLSGLTGFSIVADTIEMGRWNNVDLSDTSEVNWDDRHRGIFSSQGFGFSIQDNVLGLSSQAQVGAYTEGIVVGYVGEHDDIVYRNTATGLERGFVGEGVCASTVDSLSAGLQFQCNINAGNATNFMGRVALGDNQFPELHTIRARQGSYLLSAGNTFDQSNEPVQFYLDTYNANMPRIYYYYDEGIAAQVPDTNYLVQVVSQRLEPTLVVDTAANACATPGPGVIGGGETLGSLPGILQASKTQYTNRKLLYDQLIDGGDTQELLDAIVSIWYTNTHYEANQTLVELSPFLSATVLQEIILSTEFTEAQKIAIVIANPEGAQHGEILGLLAHEDFPPELIELVVASWQEPREGPNYRAQLEMQMTEHRTNMVQAANHWVKLLHSDTVPANPDTLRMVWQQLNTPAARYAETALLMASGSYTEALVIMEDMLEEMALNAAEVAEQGRMVKYLGVLADAAVDGRSAYQLTNVEVAVLDSMAADHYDRPSVWTRNLLCAIYGICHPPCTGGTVGEPQSRHVVPLPPTDHTHAVPALRVQPNPASNFVNISYTMLGNKGLAKLLLRDISGRVVQELTIGGEEGQATWAVQQASPGVYSVELVRDGRTVSAERLLIQR